MSSNADDVVEAGAAADETTDDAADVAVDESDANTDGDAEAKSETIEDAAAAENENGDETTTAVEAAAEAENEGADADINGDGNGSVEAEEAVDVSEGVGDEHTSTDEAGDANANKDEKAEPEKEAEQEENTHAEEAANQETGADVAAVVHADAVAGEVETVNTDADGGEDADPGADAEEGGEQAAAEVTDVATDATANNNGNGDGKTDETTDADEGAKEGTVTDRSVDVNGDANADTVINTNGDASAQNEEYADPNESEDAADDANTEEASELAKPPIVEIGPSEDGNTERANAKPKLPMIKVPAVETWSEVTGSDTTEPSRETCTKVYQHAQRVLDKRFAEASTDRLDIHQFETSLPRFWNSELVIGRRLAHGNFADIYTIRSYAESATPKAEREKANGENKANNNGDSVGAKGKRMDLSDGFEDGSSPSDHSNKGSAVDGGKDYPSDDFGSEELGDNCSTALSLMKTCPANELVIKVLRPHLLSNPRMYATGAADLVVEGTILATLRDHPHIQKIKGRSMASIDGYLSGRRDSFFLVLGRLQNGTLDDALVDWTQRSKFNSIGLGFGKDKRNRKGPLLLERIRVMKQLADAMAYLHSKRVIHRDLKLSNIGLDKKKGVRLFDFGLARIVPFDPQDSRRMYNMTGQTGSPRYMAPEVSMGKPYNLQADVYSYSIVLHEVMSLARAWKGSKPADIIEKVCNKKQRPTLSMFWPVAVRDLLKQTWSDAPSARLAMEHVHTILEQYEKQLETTMAQ